jgi:hypothetical protein
MECWKCSAPLQEAERGKISFRATCDACFAYLHCCRNCKNYRPGLPNNCAIPGTEYIADRAAGNFCDEFALMGKAPVKKDEDLKKRFDDLFSD